MTQAERDAARLLYLECPEIHAAVANVAEIATHYRKSGAREYLFGELISFFWRWDHARTEQVESLKSELYQRMAHQ